MISANEVSSSVSSETLTPTEQKDRQLSLLVKDNPLFALVAGFFIEDERLAPSLPYLDFSFFQSNNGNTLHVNENSMHRELFQYYFNRLFADENKHRLELLFKLIQPQIMQLQDRQNQVDEQVRLSFPQIDDILEKIDNLLFKINKQPKQNKLSPLKKLALLKARMIGVFGPRWEADMSLREDIKQTYRQWSARLDNELDQPKPALEDKEIYSLLKETMNELLQSYVELFASAVGTQGILVRNSESGQEEWIPIHQLSQKFELTEDASFANVLTWYYSMAEFNQKNRVGGPSYALFWDLNAKVIRMDTQLEKYDKKLFFTTTRNLVILRQVSQRNGQMSPHNEYITVAGYIVELVKLLSSAVYSVVKQKNKQALTTLAKVRQNLAQMHSINFEDLKQSFIRRDHPDYREIFFKNLKDIFSLLAQQNGIELYVNRLDKNWHQQFQNKPWFSDFLEWSSHEPSDVKQTAFASLRKSLHSIFSKREDDSAISNLDAEKLASGDRRTNKHTWILEGSPKQVALVNELVISDTLPPEMQNFQVYQLPQKTTSADELITQRTDTEFSPDSEGFIYITLPPGAKLEALTIFNELGQQVSPQTIEKSQNSGIYRVQLERVISAKVTSQYELEKTTSKELPEIILDRQKVTDLQQLFERMGITSLVKPLKKLLASPDKITLQQIHRICQIYSVYVYDAQRQTVDISGSPEDIIKELSSLYAKRGKFSVVCAGASALQYAVNQFLLGDDDRFTFGVEHLFMTNQPSLGLSRNRKVIKAPPHVRGCLTLNGERFTVDTTPGMSITSEVVETILQMGISIIDYIHWGADFGYRMTLPAKVMDGLSSADQAAIQANPNIMVISDGLFDKLKNEVESIRATILTRVKEGEIDLSMPRSSEHDPLIKLELLIGRVVSSYDGGRDELTKIDRELDLLKGELLVIKQKWNDDLSLRSHPVLRKLSRYQRSSIPQAYQKYTPDVIGRVLGLIYQIEQMV